MLENWLLELKVSQLISKWLFGVKFIYSEKATNFCKISTVDLSYIVNLHWRFCKILWPSQNIYMNFNARLLFCTQWLNTSKPRTLYCSTSFLILFVTPHVVKEFGEYLKEPRSNKIYSPGNREVKKGPELRGTERSEELERLKIHNPSDPII